MNIGILCYPTSGGSGVVATEMGAALADRGHEVHLISYRKPFRSRPARDRFKFHQVDIPTYPLFEYPSYGLAAACTLAKVVTDAELDILHVHYAYPHAVSAYLAREMTGRVDLRIVTTLHGTDISLVRQDESFALLTRFGIERSDAITAVSSFLKSVTEEWFDVRKDIDVIPNFIDTERFKPGTPGKVARIVHVSNFRPVKRSIDAIRAFYLIRRKVKATLQLVGAGPQVDEARKLTAKLGLTDDVVFAGEEPAIEKVLTGASLVLTTSEFEGFGLAPLEAMACGVPVVATKAGGVAEVVRDGKTGWLVPVGDVEKLAERSVSILKDRALAARMGKAGRAVAVRRYRTDRVIPEYERVYERLLNQAPAGGRRA